MMMFIDMSRREKLKKYGYMYYFLLLRKRRIVKVSWCDVV